MRRNREELYETMKRALSYMSGHPAAAAEEVAKHVGMSRSRFEHVFAEWVGTTPKRFLAYLTKERAREILRGDSVEKATHKAGLSSSSRLHDLLVTYEAVSPGELKAGTFTITYGIHATPFGWCVLGITKRGVCSLVFIEEPDSTRAETAIKERWAEAKLIRDDEKTAGFIKRIFGGTGKKLLLYIRGTNFQIKVWEALLRIPPGKLSDYGSIAKNIGAPKAVRAVGSACGKNGIAFLIPCHRVLTSSGALGGYRWGVERKEAMLAWEAAQTKD